jgi:hypothetical protein
MPFHGGGGGGGGGGGIDGPTLRVHLSATLPTVTGTTSVIVWQTTNWDTAGGYAAGTYTVQAGDAGVYWAHAQVWDNVAVGAQADTSILVNGTIVARGNQPTFTGNNGTDTFAVGDHLNLAEGDAVTIQIQVFGGSVAPRGGAGGERSYFSLARVASTP